MKQLSIDLGQDTYRMPFGPWVVTNKGDQACRELADRHYSRQTIGHPMFTRPGRNIVLKTPDESAVWVTWSGKRDDGYDAWECTIFRNESSHLSSDLVKWACYATSRIWNESPPKDGIITYVDDAKVASPNAGYCYIRAGFRKVGRSKKRRLTCLGLDLGLLDLIMRELAQKEQLSFCQSMIEVALNSGEFMYAEEFREEAECLERHLCVVQAAIKKEKLKAFSAYNQTLSQEDLSMEISPYER